MQSSWIIDIDSESDFPLENIPFGVFIPDGNDSGASGAGERNIAGGTKRRSPEESGSGGGAARVGTVIGDQAIDIAYLVQNGLLPGAHIPAGDVFLQPSLNRFLELGKPAWKAVRLAIQRLFSEEKKAVEQIVRGAMYPLTHVKALLPVHVTGFTDFYASKEHATNLGKILRPNEEPLKPNWVHIPVGYDGRASAVVVSGTRVYRPSGQKKPPTAEVPIFGPSTALDFELEMGLILGGPSNEAGQNVPLSAAEDRIFGMVLLNDWSARDIQAWEYVPLGPFLGKNFATTISPWVVTMDALEPFRTQGPRQDPAPLPYLLEPDRASSNENTAGDAAGMNAAESLKQPGNYDIRLSAALHLDASDGTGGHLVTETNVKWMYWSGRQMVAHHSVNGCVMRTGDILGTGTISGAEEGSWGSLIEITRRVSMVYLARCVRVFLTGVVYFCF